MSALVCFAVFAAMIAAAYALEETERGRRWTDRLETLLRWDPMQLGCGCPVGAHENSLAGIRANHPDVIVPDDDGTPRFYGVRR